MLARYLAKRRFLIFQLDVIVVKIVKDVLHQSVPHSFDKYRFSDMGELRSDNANMIVIVFDLASNQDASLTG